MTCTSGLHALLVARALIVADEIDLAIVVGCEAALTPFTIDQVTALRISPRYDSTDPYPCRPFSKEEPNRSRMVLGEGAAALVVLGESAANRVKGRCYHRVDGIGFSAESPPSLTGIGSEGTHFQDAMARAIKNARLSIGDISGIICHAPGTPKGDRAEWHALGAVFGETIPALHSTKWLTGHTYGASGLLSIELACLIAEGLTPAAPAFSSYAPQLVDSERERKLQVGGVDKFLINAAGFGGNAISVIVSYRP
jgi:3-oxoacyl-(acyl-carrier-protein) synthase